MRKYEIRIQHHVNLRWRDIFHWTVLTTEDDMRAMLNVTCKQNWRILVIEQPNERASRTDMEPHK